MHVQKRSRAECVEEARALLAKVGMSERENYIPRIFPEVSSSVRQLRARSPCGPR